MLDLLKQLNKLEQEVNEIRKEIQEKPKETLPPTEEEFEAKVVALRDRVVGDHTADLFAREIMKEYNRLKEIEWMYEDTQR